MLNWKVNEVGLSFPKRFLLDHFRTYDFANGILWARHEADSWYLKTAMKKIALVPFGFLPVIARKSLNYNKKGCAFA